MSALSERIRPTLEALDPRKAWLKTKLRTRISLSVASILVVLIAVFAAILYKYLSEDKRAYAFDAAFAESESAASQLSQHLSKITDKQDLMGFIPFVGAQNPQEVNLVRWPERNELFVGRWGDKQVAFLRGDENILLFGEAAALFAELDRKIPALTILATTTGEVLSTGGRPAKTVDAYIKEFIRAGVKKGVHSFALENDKKTFAFSEAINSNLVVITDAFIEDSELQVRALTLVVFFILLCLVTISSSATVFFVRRSLSPLAEINEAASQIAVGNYKHEITYRYRDEIHETFQRIDNMRLMLEIRDNKLSRTNTYLSQVLELLRIAVREADSPSAITEALRTLVKPNIFTQRVMASYFDGEIRVEFNAEGIKAKGISNWFDNQTLQKMTSGLSDLDSEGQEIEEGVFVFEDKKLVLCDLLSHPKSKEHRGWIIVGPLTTQLLDLASIRFLGAFTSSVRSALHTIVLKREAIEKAQMQLAFEAAAAIQENLSVSVDLPKNIEIASMNQCAEQVGGDWHGTFYHKPSNTLYCYIADATGHGLNATLVVASVRGAIESLHFVHANKTAEQMNTFLSDCAASLDQLIHEVSGGQLTMTMIIMAIALDSGSIRFLNFGHPSPLIYSPLTGKFRALVTSSTAGSENLLQDSLGTRMTSTQSSLEPHTELLQSLEVVCLFTDGCTECEDVHGQILGRRAWRVLLQESIEGKPTVVETLQSVRTRLKSYCEGRPLADDMSLLLVKRTA